MLTFFIDTSLKFINLIFQYCNLFFIIYNFIFKGFFSFLLLDFFFFFITLLNEEITVLVTLSYQFTNK